MRIDAEAKTRLDALCKRPGLSKSGLAAEAESEQWQLEELHAGIADLDSGQEVSHGRVSKWLDSWGTPVKTKAPR